MSLQIRGLNPNEDPEGGLYLFRSLTAGNASYFSLYLGTPAPKQKQTPFRDEQTQDKK